MTKEELQQLAHQWPKGKPLVLPGIIEDAYQAGFLAAIALVNQFNDGSKGLITAWDTADYSSGRLVTSIFEELIP